MPERREALKRVVKSVTVFPATWGRNRFDPRRIGVRFRFEAFAMSGVEDSIMDEFGNVYDDIEIGPPLGLGTVAQANQRPAQQRV